MASGDLHQSEEISRSMSMELALSLSEVFEALKEISSGNPDARVPETSELELIAKLKHTVNLTAENLAEIVNLSHEFAMGLAEHFDVLHRVSKGDLNARISGTSQVELLESLKEVTNHTIEDVSAQIAKRERTEQVLIKSRDYLDGIINGIYEGLLVIDRNFIIKDVNEPFLKEYGSAREDIIGRACYEITHNASKPCSSSDHRCPVTRVFDTGKPTRVEHIHRDRMGSELIVELYAVPLLAKDGAVENVVELSHNITEHKRAEEERKELEAQLRRAEKMEAIGMLAGGVAHDLNNILSGLVSYPDLLLMDLPEDSPLTAPILTIQKSGKKAAAIVQDLLTLARRGVAVTEVANLFPGSFVKNCYEFSL
jgi:PAS domain S-box-containing protein